MKTSTEPATEKIWKDFHQALFAFVKKRVHDSNLTEYLLQDIFVKIHLNLPALSQKEKLTSWIYQIARNTITDHYRKNKLLTPVTPEMIPADHPKDHQPDFTRCLQPFVDQLPEPYRAAILATDLGPYSQKEYAAQAGISYSGLKSRVQRGRQQLHDLFTQCCAISTDKYGNILTARPGTDCNCS